MLFPSSIGNIFLPVVSRLLGRKDISGMREVMSTAHRWSLFITLPIAVVMIAFSSDMLSVFYGAGYSSGAAAMAVFTIGLLFAAFSYVASLALTAMRMVRIELYVAAACGAVNLVLNFALVPHLGMEGAAVASTVSFALSAVLLGHFTGKLLGYRNPPETYRLVAAALLVLMVAMGLRPAASAAASSLVAQAAAGEFLPKALYLAVLGVMIALSGALFVAVALALKCFHAEDVALMRRALEKAGAPASVAALAEKVAAYGVRPGQ